MAIEVDLRTADGRIYRPLPAQAAFHGSSAWAKSYTGGFGCLAAETLVEGVPVAELDTPSLVRTLAGPSLATPAYRKGAADLYEVRTGSGAVVVVTAEHRFLTPHGWRPLRLLRAGSVVAAGGECLDSPDFWDEVQSVRWVKFGEFYDLHVPGAEHYLAHGLYHHNSGKTQCGAVEAVLQSLEVGDGRGGVGVIARYDWGELLNTTWKCFVETIPPPIRKLCTIRLSPTPSCIFPNGFEVLGFNLKKHESMQSLNLSWGWIDEAGEDGVDEKSYLQLVGRRRNKIGRRCLWVTGNPAGRAHWTYKRFHAYLEDPTARRYKGHEGFHATTSENIYLPEDYKRAMEETYPEEWLERYYSGSFDVFEGQILTEFDGAVHVVDPFLIPESWPRFRGLDHGINHPTASVVLAVAPNGDYVVYKEYWRKGQTPEENSRAILEMCRDEEEQIRWTVIDPATQARQTAGGVMETIMEQYRRGGLLCHPGDNDVKARVVLLKSLLKPDSGRFFPKFHPKAGQPGAPRLYVTRNCKTLRWEMENWRWKDVRPGRVDREQTHAVDDDLIAALRYTLMRRPYAEEPAEVLTDHRRFMQILREIRGEEEAAELRIGVDRLTGHTRVVRHWEQTVPRPEDERTEDW